MQILVLSLETGSFPMELVFPAHIECGTSIEPEVLVWYNCTAEEVELRGSTAVRYPIL